MALTKKLKKIEWTEAEPNSPKSASSYSRKHTLELNQSNQFLNFILFSFK